MPCRVPGGDTEKTWSGYRDWLTMDDVEAVLACYEEYPYDVDKNLWDNEHDLPCLPGHLELIRQLSD